MSANEYSAYKYRNNLVEVQQVLKKKKSLAKLGMGGLYQGRLPKGGDN